MKSEIVIFDLQRKTEKILFASDSLIEAPNWTPDGTSLVVNGDGRIFRVPIGAPALEPVDTGFAVQCNNDHGISPDGRLLVVSDSTEDGKSAIYTLPFAGGLPQRVTPESPSYWHGWSPDGAQLAYTANRGRGFEIYTIAVTGGEEFQVTNGFDHCDGPDYSADGNWIWFNGERNGAVDLWRVRPNGTGFEQMTEDAPQNWFPHPSPDGNHVVYLAYEEGTSGHPRDRHVALRVMPAEGGAPVTLTELFGGQGTINVPSWAPDSRRFAFVKYAHG